MAKMLGNVNQPPCGSKCCGKHNEGRKHVRLNKRRERQAIRVAIRAGRV